MWFVLMGISSALTQTVEYFVKRSAFCILCRRKSIHLIPVRALWDLMSPIYLRGERCNGGAKKHARGCRRYCWVSQKTKSCLTEGAMWHVPSLWDCPLPLRRAPALSFGASWIPFVFLLPNPEGPIHWRPTLVLITVMFCFSEVCLLAGDYTYCSCVVKLSFVSVDPSLIAIGLPKFQPRILSVHTHQQSPSTGMCMLQ